ncbi:MAG TPA: hypothetical protein DIU15_12965, partial [Deltaproteobacteria bacterium]|nr:hypothetical protein [Deltaproteobacteria bacterium]
MTGSAPPRKAPVLPSASATVVLAAHNEAGAVGAVLRQVRSVLGDVEIIVVDDGSTDGTADEAEAEGALVIRCWPNQGKG